VVIVFGAHEFPELLLAVLLPVSFPCAPALDPNEKYPDPEGHGKVWKGVRLMQGSQHGARGNQASENEKEESFHDVWRY
jgi:hypothetical protein